jgi:hypothetical protein
VVAKVAWHPRDLYPRVGFVVTNLTRPAACVTAVHSQGGMAEQEIKEVKNAVTWTRLSSRCSGSDRRAMTPRGSTEMA